MKRWMRLVAAIILQQPWPGLKRYVHRLLVGVPLLLLLALTQGLNGLSLMLDNLLFRQYRHVKIHKPVFVVGAPRSGTTFMHRLLALDACFTTFSTVECLFAPSIIQRMLMDCMKRLDTFLGGPLAALLAMIEGRLLGRIEHLHPTRLGEAEEDYFTLLPQLACFLLIVPFPEARWLHHIARLDAHELPPQERARLLDNYHRALQRHVYWHCKQRGAEIPCVLLSKNASFAGSVNTLAKRYPDARFIVCRRDALRSIDSQFRVLAPVQRWFGLNPCDRRFRDDMTKTLEHYQHSLDRLLNTCSSVVEVPLPQLSRDTSAAIDRVYKLLGSVCPMAVELELLNLAKAGTQQSLTTVTSPSAPSADPELVRRFASWRFAEGERL